MRNGLLVIAYMIVFAIMIFSYESWNDNELVVMGVVATFLFTGLALWVFVAQKHRNPPEEDD